MISRSVAIVFTVAASSSAMRRLYPTASALRTAVSLRLKASSAMRHPPVVKVSNLRTQYVDQSEKRSVE